MSHEKSVKRRAVITGLRPYMDEAALTQALNYWEQHYADTPRFALQKFVSEIARVSGLQSYRSNMLLSLVQAMNMPVDALLPDSLAGPLGDPALIPSERASAAFVLLMTTLMKTVPPAAHHNFSFDLLASLDNPNLPFDVVNGLDEWLGRNRALILPPAQPLVLRALVNRTYVLLCERLGPVEADRLLFLAVNTSLRVRRELSTEITDLL